MSEKILNDLEQYIHFLGQQGYTLSLSCFNSGFSPVLSELLRYDLHPHAVCTFLKQNPGTASRCIQNKGALCKLFFRRPFFSCCYAGVEEYVLPVIHKGELLLYIHLSGYRGTLTRSRRYREETQALCPQKFGELYQELSSVPPTMAQVLSFTRPINYMIVALYRHCRAQEGKTPFISPAEGLYLKALQYIQDNYMNPLSGDILARELQYSASYLRYVFKKEGNLSVQAKITQIRLANARRFLLETNMNITEIAQHCGFEDPNYFSVAFKKSVGLSPLQYRKSGGK